MGLLVVLCFVIGFELLVFVDCMWVCYLRGILCLWIGEFAVWILAYFDLLNLFVLSLGVLFWLVVVSCLRVCW